MPGPVSDSTNGAGNNTLSVPVWCDDDISRPLFTVLLGDGLYACKFCYCSVALCRCMGRNFRHHTE